MLPCDWLILCTALMIGSVSESRASVVLAMEESARVMFCSLEDQ